MVTAAALPALLLGARAVSARRVRATAPVEPRTEEPAAPPAPRPSHARPSARPPPRQTRAEMARLQGRVILPPGIEAESLEVKADDGLTEYPAAVSAGGAFDVHLPPQTYTVTATLGSLVAMRAGVAARPGATEQLTLTLEPAVSIAGTVAPATKEGYATILVTRAGSEVRTELSHTTDWHFEVGGLVRGATYDVTASDAGRSAVVRAVVAPATIEVALAPLVILRGQIGFEPGSRCPFKSVFLMRDDGVAAYRQERVDRNCHFRFEDVTREPVQLRASGPGWHAHAEVVIPAEGEPDVVCLNPPCRDLPPVDPASLRVIVTGLPEDASVSAYVQQEDDGRACSGGGGCTVSNLSPGTKGELSVAAQPCAAFTRTITLVSGENAITIPCRRTRVVEGIVRGSDGQPAVVGCQSGEEIDLRDSAIFHIQCPADATELRYRSGTRPWQTAALPAGLDRAFVELAP